MEAPNFDGLFGFLITVGIIIGLLVGGGSCVAGKKRLFRTVGEDVYVKYKGDYHFVSRESYELEKSMKAVARRK